MILWASLAVFAAGAATGGAAAWTLQGWRLGTQLQHAKGEIALFEAADKERERASALAAANNLKNKERTDAQYKIDVAAAHARGVRVGSDRQFVKSAPTASSERELACFDAGELDRELSAWAERVAGRFNVGVRQAEEVAAAFRSCQAWALNLP